MGGSIKMTREEMIRMAQETRAQVTNAPVSRELLEQYPAVIRECQIPGRDDTMIHCYYSESPEHKEHADTLIINFHGGGFIRGRTPNDEVFARRMNHGIGCKVLDVDYKLAPDYPFPTAVHEAYDVTAWAFTHADELGISEDKIILMGHSAGGNLAIGVVMKALEEKLFHPFLLIADYPPLDLYTDPGDKQKMGQGIPAERARLYNLYYCDREEQKNPYASPVYAGDEQLKDFPRTLIMTASTDDLCNEAEEFALRLARLGNEVTLKRFQGARHGFTIYRTEGGDEAVGFIRRYICAALM